MDDDKKADTEKRNERLEDFEEHLYKLDAMKK
jgi:hypothetical protein